MSMSGKAIITASLAVALGVGGVPCFAFAEESAQAPATDTAQAPATLDEAWATYGELSLQVAEVGESLNDTYYQLEQSEANEQTLMAQVDETTQKLEAARVVLGERVSANYKAGSSSLLDLLLGTDSFESLIAALHYVDKLTDADVAAVNEVKAISDQLEEQRTALETTQEELRKLAGQKEQQIKDLQASLDQQKNYIASLSEPLRAAFDERKVTEIVEQQARAVEALAAQETALAQAASQESGNTNTATGNNSTQSPSADPSSTNGADVASAVATIASETAAATSGSASTSTDASASTDSGATSAPSTSGLSSDARAAILEAAYSQIGVEYVYGASSPGEAFDCSGLTSWAYAQAGIDIPHSSAAQAQMADTVSSADDLQPGDLVFYIGNVGASQSGNHVAIYAGDGQVIHANGSEVVVSDMNDSWTSAGSIGLDE